MTRYIVISVFAETKAVTHGCLHIQPPFFWGLYEQDFIMITEVILNFILLLNIAWRNGQLTLREAAEDSDHLLVIRK